MLLALMKKHDVAKTVIIQVIHYRWDNSYLASVLKQHRDTFHGVARVDPEDPANPDTLSKLVQEQGSAASACLRPATRAATGSKVRSCPRSGSAASS